MKAIGILRKASATDLTADYDKSIARIEAERAKETAISHKDLKTQINRDGETLNTDHDQANE